VLPAIIGLGLSFIHHAKGPQLCIVASQEVLVPSLNHPHLPCFQWCFYGACGSSASCPLAPFLAVLMLLHCHISPPINAHRVPLCDPRQRPPHDMVIDVKVNQRVPDFVRHILHHVKAMRMQATIAVDNNMESKGVNEWSLLTLRKSLLSCS
jgi:hypothetical protein